MSGERKGLYLLEILGRHWLMDEEEVGILSLLRWLEWLQVVLVLVCLLGKGSNDRKALAISHDRRQPSIDRKRSTIF